MATKAKRDNRAAYLLSEGGIVASALTLLTTSLWGATAGACVVAFYIVGWVANWLILERRG